MGIILDLKKVLAYINATVRDDDERQLLASKIELRIMELEEHYDL
ncbi:hypothetical protein GECART_560 [Achromobacter phage vB_AdeS_ART]|nr:hypothetical protein ART_00048 [Achromobacter phage vB_Ade_ART]